jgi:hypothetical protein
MTDTQQIALAIAPTVLPTLTVLVGILLSNRQVDALRSEMRDRFAGVDRGLDVLQDDVKLLTGKMGELDTSVRVIEERLK